ncbi:hypothetical protein J5N97_024636 [Dioscorea zingiberensis]|uniref:Uncharacterized protein n=1 Tax=Dioscorea zingiberensis TaxID=325984 RepID=A0A9D5C7C1_9LILI|nr:hypothetical protein J5N97_024636 [Dioscorea zingiberensis]
MAAALAALSSPPSWASTSRIEVARNQRNLTLQHCSHISRSYYRRIYTTNLVQASAAEHFGKPTKFTDYLNNLADKAQHATSKTIKEFPWNEAKDLVLVRVLLLAKNVATWFFIACFIFGSISDLYLSVARKKELMIPIGLFIGVILAEILRESSVEFFQKSLKDEETTWHLIGVGFIFILVRLISLCFNLQGRLLLSHISNGGLMQVLWLMKRKQQTEHNKDQDEQTTNAHR